MNHYQLDSHGQVVPQSATPPNDGARVSSTKGVPGGTQWTPPWLAEPALILAGGGVLLTLFGLALLALVRRQFGRRLRVQGAALVQLDRRLARVEERTATAYSPLPAPPSAARAVLGSVVEREKTLPRVVFARRLLPALCEYVAGFLAAEGEENEAGAVLLGEFRERGGDTIIHVRGFIPAGPGADFSPGSILFDAPWQTRILNALQIQHPTVTDVGMAHRHPGHMDHCSAGDEAADRAAVASASSHALVFAILTLDNPPTDNRSVVHGRFKLDVYVMTAATNYRYVKVQPEFDDEPLVQVSAAVLRLCDQRGASVLRQDLDVLRQIGARVTIQGGAGTESVLCQLSLPTRDYCLQVQCGADSRLDAVLSQRGVVRKLTGPWERPDTGGHVWFSHLLMLALAENNNDHNRKDQK